MACPHNEKQAVQMIRHHHIRIHGHLWIVLRNLEPAGASDFTDLTQADSVPTRDAEERDAISSRNGNEISTRERVVEVFQTERVTSARVPLAIYSSPFPRPCLHSTRANTSPMRRTS